MKILSSPKEQGVPEVVTQSEQQAKGLRRAFIALRHRNYRLFWFGQLISLIGTWMQTTAQAWLVLELTKSAWLLGVVGALQFLPVLLLALLGGVLADRLPKRTVLLCTQTSAMLQAFALWILVATGYVQIWHVLVLASLLGLTNAVDMPTRQAFVVEMVGREDLPNAVALNSSLFNMARIVGPGMGGLLIAWLGVAPLFLLNALSFIAVIVGLSMIRIDELHIHVKQALQTEQQRLGTWQSLHEGLAYVRRTPSVLLVIVIVGLISLFGINFNVVLPLFATDVLNVGPQGFGFISSAFGVGSLLSALWLAWGNNKPNIRQLLQASLTFGVLEILFAISHMYALSLLLIAAVGFSQIAFSAIANTTVQTVTPDYLRGRVMSLYMMVFAGSIPPGNLFMGGLAHFYGVSIALTIGAALSIAAAIGGWLWRKPAEQDLAKSSLIE